MSSEANKDIIRRLIEESFNTRNMDVLEALVDPSYVDHGPFDGQAAGVEGMKQAHMILYSGFPDVQQTIDDLIAEGDRVVARWSCQGTHTGDFIGIPPTGRVGVVTGIDIFRIADGKIMECWHEVNSLGLMQQLGVIPPIGQADEAALAEQPSA
jgi:steroid delta-isomerase-like uncharacterized protein